MIVEAASYTLFVQRKLIAGVLVLSSFAAGQAGVKPDLGMIESFSVCEAIRRSHTLNGKFVAVAGRFDKLHGILRDCAPCNPAVKSRGAEWGPMMYISAGTKAKETFRQFSKSQQEWREDRPVVLIGYIYGREKLMATEKDGAFLGNGFGSFGMFPAQLTVLGICPLPETEMACGDRVIRIRTAGCVMADGGNREESLRIP